MITEAQFHGGARHRNVSSSFTLSAADSRVQSLNVTTPSLHVTMPTPTGMQPGGVYFIIQNIGTQSITLDTNPEVVLTANKSASVWLHKSPLGVYRWVCVTVRTINTATALSTVGGELPSTFEPEEEISYEPECTLPCDEDLGVIDDEVPMFINSCEAKNSLRDPIRGADLAIPPKVQIRVFEGFVRDNSHSHASDISDRAMTLLRKFHVLTYDDSTGWGTTSNNPYHVGLVLSSAWDHAGDIAVERHVWRKIINYRAGGQDHTIELRMAIEWSTDPDNGLWGSLVSFMAFCSEVNPTYEDGDPDPGQNDCEFTRNDPCTYGPLYFGANTNIKFFHPQLLFYGVIPTTFHSPCEYDHIPVGDELWDECYKLSNGAPWSGGDIAKTWKNCVFAKPDSLSGTGYTLARAMTIGGDVPTSQLFPFICIENGSGYGGTYLKPTNAGWDEDAGSLTSNSDIELTDCQNTPQTEVNKCEGHPSDPYGGVGGTHRCFKTSDNDKYCCLPLESAHAVIQETCCEFRTPFGPYNELSLFCDGGPTSCKLHEYFRTDVELELDDYDFKIESLADRFIRWKYVAPDPDYVVRMFTMAANFADLQDEQGTWSVTGTSATCSSVAGSPLGTGLVNAALVWLPGSYTCGHATIEAVAKFTMSSVIHAIGVRYASGVGYIGRANPSTGLIELYRTDGSTNTLLGSATITIGSNDKFMSLTARGSTIIFTVGTEQIHVSDCGGINWSGSLMVGCVGTGAVFEDIRLTDQNVSNQHPGLFTSLNREMVLTIVGGSTEQTMTFTKNAVLQSMYGQCDSTDNSMCGEVDSNGDLHCDCVKLQYTECKFQTSVTEWDTTDFANVTIPGGENPTDCAPCSICPPEYVDVAVRLPSECVAVPEANRWIYCEGADWWVSSVEDGTP